jgi:hypothetical protein
MCLGTHSAETAVANQEQAYTSTMMQEGAQIFGQDSSVFNSLVGNYMPIANAGPSQLGFSGGQYNAMTAANVQNYGAAYRNAAAALGTSQAAGGAGRFGAEIPVVSGTNIGKNAMLASGFAQGTASGQNQILAQDYAQGNTNWKQAMQGLQAAPSVMNNSAMFSGQIQSGLATEMNNAQAQDARANWWVPSVTGELGNMGSNLQQSASDAMQQASNSSGGQGSGGGLLGAAAMMFGG